MSAVSNWLSKRLFPPSIRQTYDWDNLIEQAEEDRFTEYKTFEIAEEEAQALYDSDSTNENRDKWFAATEAKDKRETEMLNRLIALRGYLWT